MGVRMLPFFYTDCTGATCHDLSVTMERLIASDGIEFAFFCTSIRSSRFLFRIRSKERCTTASKINVTPKCVYLPISKVHWILAVANLFAPNRISQISYSDKISLQKNFIAVIKSLLAKRRKKYIANNLNILETINNPW